MLIDEHFITHHLGKEFANSLSYRKDSLAVIAHHGENAKGIKKVPDSIDFFRKLGHDIKIVDLFQHEGHEIVLDLNVECPQEMWQQFDLVIDAGTLEHVFNIGMAAINVANLVDVGGYVYHNNPLQMFNHGFFNFNPTFFVDFYCQNGFDVCHLQALMGRGTQRQRVELPPNGRFESRALSESVIETVAQRMVFSEIRAPIQNTYSSSLVREETISHFHRSLIRPPAWQRALQKLRGTVRLV
jgi:hypothetical protein